jgi:hypothetical protein
MTPPCPTATPDDIVKTLTRIASNLNGRLLAYAEMGAGPEDHRYVIAYAFGRSAWVCAIVDIVSGRYLDGVINRGPATPDAISAAFAAVKANGARGGAPFA